MIKKTILIVDDLYENLYLLRVILEKSDFIVIEALNGEEALEKLHKHSVDLIISDILMPVMDGYMFCQACKKDKLFKNIPFVFYTSTYTEKSDEEFAFKLGAAHFLIKPTDPDKILQLVKELLTLDTSTVKPKGKEQFTEKEVLKLYSKRLIRKLEQKNLDLEKEIFEREKAEQKLINENGILELIANNTPIKKVFDHIIINYESLHPEFLGSISLLQEDGVHLDLISAPNIPKTYNLAIKQVEIGKNVGSCGTAAFSKKAVIVSDISTDKLWVDYKDIALKHNLKSCWSIPIRSEKDVVLGTFAIYSNAIKTPSLEDIRELYSTVNLAKIAIVKFNISAEVKKRDESYKSLINQASDAILTYSFDGTIHNLNKATYKILGYTKNEFLELNIEDIIVGNIVENQATYEKILNGKSIIFERQLICKNGVIIDAEISAKLQTDGKVLAIIRDVTERKRAEIELKAAKEFTDKLIMSMQEGLIIVNLEGTIIMVNESICGILGYSNDELVGLNLPYPFVTKNESDRILKAYEKEASAESLNYKIEFIRKNGEKFLASFLSGNINNDEGEVIALFGTIKDISEEEKAKKLLIETATRSTKKKHVIMELSALVGSDYNKSLQQITALSADTLNVARVGVWKFNEDKTSIVCEKLYVLKTGKFENGVILSRNDNPNYFDALADSKTVSVEDAVNNDITKGFAKDYLVPFGISSMLDVFIHGGQGSYGVICFEHIGVKRKWSADEEEFATSIANIVSLMVENKERIEAESLLRRAKEFSEKLITSLHEGLSVVDLNGTHIKVNQALCEMTGFSEAELVGKKAPFPYWPPECIDEINVAFKNPLKAIDDSMYFTFMRKNGERFPVSLTNSSIKNKEGEIEAYFSTINDISIRVKAEEILKENIRISDQRRHIIIELANLIGEDFNSSLKKIATTASEALNADLVTIWKYKNEKRELVSRLFYKSKDKKFDFDGLVIKEEDYLNYFKVFKDKNSINITDVINNPITKDFAKTYFIPNNISSRIDVLIYGRNDHYGIISFESKTAGRIFTNEEESFVTSIASIVSLMIESSERQIAENNLVLSNNELSKANIELNNLRDQLEQENVYLRNELDLVFNYEEMVYGSEAFSNVLTEVEKVAPTNATVLLLGESGTGKELLARAIHKIGSRNKKPLIKVNCSAIPRELIESELFGHKKGSFTGAFSDKIGKFELADGGTLFLDEIGELPLDMQPKILRFLQEGEIEVVGGMQLKKLDVRVIAATNRNLKEEIEKKQFREDLYFRINVFPIQIPPLRKRKEDIPLLVEHFVDKFNKSYEKSIKYIPSEAMEELESYNWPGNIRELENLIERAVILSDSETLMITPVNESSVLKELSSMSSLTLNDVQRNYIIKILEKCDWKIDGEHGASNLLDIKPSTLRDRMKKLGIKKPSKT